MVLSDYTADEKGYSAKRKSNIENLLKNSFLSLEQISRIYRIPLEELNMYLSRLNIVTA